MSLFSHCQWENWFVNRFLYKVFAIKILIWENLICLLSSQFKKLRKVFTFVQLNVYTFYFHSNIFLLLICSVLRLVSKILLDACTYSHDISVCVYCNIFIWLVNVKSEWLLHSSLKLVTMEYLKLDTVLYFSAIMIQLQSMVLFVIYYLQWVTHFVTVINLLFNVNY